MMVSHDDDRGIGTALALLSTSGASSVVTAHSVVTLVRVPDNGIQPEAVVDGRGMLHVLYLCRRGPRGESVLYPLERSWRDVLATDPRHQPGR